MGKHVYDRRLIVHDCFPRLQRFFATNCLWLYRHSNRTLCDGFTKLRPKSSNRPLSIDGKNTEVSRMVQARALMVADIIRECMLLRIWLKITDRQITIQYYFKCLPIGFRGVIRAKIGLWPRAVIQIVRFVSIWRQTLRRGLLIGCIKTF